MLLFPAQRYGCIQCGKSCSDWRVWVEPQDQAAVRRHPLALEQALLPDGPHMRLAQDESGRCILLTSDNLCALHRDQGWRSKPRTCRQFPFFLVETPDGIQVGLSFRCTAVQQDLGVPWSEHQSSLQELVEEGIPRVGFEPALLGAYRLDWDVYRAWEVEWQEQLVGGESLTRAVSGRLSPALNLEGNALERLVLWLSASAVGFLESQSSDQVAQVAAALRAGQGYSSSRRGWVDGVTDPFAGEHHQHSLRYLGHVLERKTLWLGGSFLGRLLMLLTAERMLFYYEKLDGFWSAVDRLEGEWLAHRRGLENLELQFANTLLHLC